MKRIHFFTLVGALSVLLANPVHAQDSDDSSFRGGAAPSNPVAALVSQREEIGLSPQQTAALTRIARLLDERNQALAGRLAPAEGRGGSGEADGRQRAEQRTAFDAVAENTRRAAAEARSILTPEQRVRADLLVERRKRAGGNRP